MFKKGFTLAEILITFGVVGIVAALTIPGLVANANRAQIGPKLASTVSNLENGMKAMLDAEQVDSLNDLPGAFIDGLENYMAITIVQSQYGITKDGVKVDFWIGTMNTETPYAYDSTKKPHQNRIGTVVIDINGEREPNSDATDVFYFSWWHDGSLRPQGATGWNGSSSSNPGGTEHWSNKCNTTPSRPKYCAGHIFENDLKVLYN